MAEPTPGTWETRGGHKTGERGPCCNPSPRSPLPSPASTHAKHLPPSPLSLPLALWGSRRAAAADPCARRRPRPLGCSGGRRRTPRRRAGRGHAAHPGAAQAPPFAPHRNLGRLRRRKAVGSAPLRGAAGTCRPAPPAAPAQGAQGTDSRRGEAGRRRPRPPRRSCLPAAPRRGGRPSLCLQEHRPPGPRTRMRDPVRSHRLPRSGERGRGGAGGALPLRLHPAALRQ